jgi:hypothetical protein
MFSDNHKLIKVLFPLVIIFAMVVYGIKQIPLIYPNYAVARNNHISFTGKTIYIGGKIIAINKHYFIIRSEKNNIHVVGSIGSSNLGSQISGKATFNKDQTIIFRTYHISNLRTYKILLSLLPLPFIFFLFFKQYKFNLKRMTFESNKQITQ